MNDKWTPRNIAKQKKKHRWTIDDKESCEQAIHTGVILSCVSAAIMFVLVFYNYFIGFDNDSLSASASTDVLFDVIFLLVLAFFTNKKSRVASVLLSILMILEVLFKIADGYIPHGFILIWDFLLVSSSINASRATFLWHLKYKHEKNGILKPTISN